MPNNGKQLTVQDRGQEMYDLAGKMEQDASRRSQIFYNMGTILHGQKKLDEAISAYKQAALPKLR